MSPSNDLDQPKKKSELKIVAYDMIWSVRCKSWKLLKLWSTKVWIYMVASFSGSASTGTAGVLFPPLRREDTLSMAEFNWPIFAFNVCLVFCFSQKSSFTKIYIYRVPIQENFSNELREIEDSNYRWRQFRRSNLFFVCLQVE